MSDALRVGIIGLNADRGWARESHAPAIIATPGLDLAAVATRSTTTAEASARAFGIPTVHSDPHALLADSDIDIVAVVSAVPTHRELVLAALNAGKHVVTEWPVTVDVATTAQIADPAHRSGRHTAVGLQARMNPAVRRASAIVREGRLGSVRTVRVTSSTAAFGPMVSESDAALEDAAVGMNLTTIQAAHTLDLVGVLSGGLRSVTALRSIQYPRVEVLDTDRVIDRTLPDQVMVTGRLSGGGSAVVEIVGGRSLDTPFRLEIEGSEAVLVLAGGAPRGFQSGVLDLSVDGDPVPVDVPDVADPVVNIAGLYAALRDDILTGSQNAPSFSDALRLAHLVDDVINSDNAGRRVMIGDHETADRRKQVPTS